MNSQFRLISLIRFQQFQICLKINSFSKELTMLNHVIVDTDN